MRRLAQPNEDASKVYRQCALAVRGNTKRSRMLSVETDVVAAAVAYAMAATGAALHQIPQTDGVAGTVTTQEMMSLYKTHMVRKNAVARGIYDRLMNSPPRKKCPLCGQRVVTTIDHHLPESLYPVFAVFALNLVPACSDCNKKKGTAAPGDANHQTAHPYFDDFESERWLYAKVCHGQPAALDFLVAPPEHWDEVKKRRATYHFTLLKLNELYVAHAAEELVNIRYRLIGLYKKAGSKGVHDHLQYEAESRADLHVNSWQTAAYEALAADSWFCDGGFAET